MADPVGNRDDKIGGWTVEGWGGINLVDPPHLIAKNEFQHLENSRWAGVALVPRPGQDPFIGANPAGAGFFLWGGYGGVLQHGGVGGVGFKDDSSAEEPAAPGGIVLLWS